MTDKEVASGIQAVPELLDQALLLGFIEVDHDVAAEDDVVATWQEFGLEIVKVELDQLFERGLGGVFVSRFLEIAQTRGVIHGLHLNFRVEPFLAGAQRRVTNVRGENLEFPWRRDERLRQGHVERQRVAKVVVGQRVANEHRDRIGFLTRRTARAPHAEVPVASLLFVVQKLFQNAFLEKFELRLIAEETRFVDREILARRERSQRTPGTGSAASSMRLYSERCRSFAISTRMMSRPSSLPTPVT